MNDTISRQDALEQIAQAECGLHYEDCKADNCTCDYIWRIRNIPSAEKKTGKWIENVVKWGNAITTVHGYRCSECGALNLCKDKFCPNCGARMKG